YFGRSQRSRLRLDQITFGDVGVDAFAGFGFDLTNIDWSDPMNTCRKRRSSSKLASLPSQKLPQDESHEHASEDEYGDEDDVELGREGKRQRIASSPHFAARRDTTLRRSSIYHPSESIGGNLFQEPYFPMNEQIDLKLPIDGEGDISISAPSRMGFELADGGCLMEQDVPEYIFNDASVLEGRPESADGKMTGDWTRKSQGGEELGGDRQTLEVSNGKIKTKKAKNITFDADLELPTASYYNSAEIYALNMEREKREREAREQHKLLANQATSMVDGGGGWLEFFDPEMKAFFSTITKASRFKWELDVARYRLGSKWSPESSQERVDQRRMNKAYTDDRIQLTDSRHQDDFGTLTHDNVRRPESEMTDVEYGRNVTQERQPSVLPWDGRAFIVDDGDSGSRFRLSLLTPLEARIRSRVFLPGTGSTRLAGRGRSRSGSIFNGRTEDVARMLIEDDTDLPDVNFDLDSPPAWQVKARAELPVPFQPAMLATLEKQCRDFMSYAERHMLDEGVAELDFEVLAQLDKAKRVAALAFYNCLTLTTKGILTVCQLEPWGTIKLRFTVQV
ncbi:MAG: hypothetical protein TREMPRED_005950, partial [Tremellales sp. Tagirdzhanova-0007]